MTIVSQNGPCTPSRWTWAFCCADNARFPSPFAALLFIALINSLGCSRREPPELPLHAQVAEVDRGTRETIQIEAVALGDVDLDSLAYVTGLQNLLLDNPNSQFSSTGLANLHRLTDLKHLRIRGHGIDDAALVEIAKITSLRILNIPQAAITDAGIAHLAELPNLELLRFGSSHISLAGIEALTALPSLKRLHLIDVPVNDQALQKLASMKQLESLYIDGGSFSEAAADELFRSRPDLHVHFNQEHHDRDPHRHSHR
jgi:hypothetical protein